MNIFDLITLCSQAGVWLQWTGSKVKAIGDEVVLQKMLPILKANKQALQDFFASDAGEAYEERAAIMQFDGGMSRAEAETQAAIELNKQSKGDNYD